MKMWRARLGLRTDVQRNRDEVLGLRRRTSVSSSSSSLDSERSWNDDHLVLGSRRGEPTTTNRFLDRLQYKALNLDAAHDVLGEEAFDREMLSENPSRRHCEANQFISEQARESSDNRVSVEVAAELSRLDNGAVEPEQYGIDNPHPPGHRGIHLWRRKSNISEFHFSRYQWLRKNNEPKPDADSQQLDPGRRLEVAVAEGIDASQSDESSDDDVSSDDEEDSEFSGEDRSDYYYHSSGSGGHVHPDALEGERVCLGEGGGDSAGLDGADVVGGRSSTVVPGESENALHSNCI